MFAKDCGPPVAPLYGSVNYTNTTFDSTAEVSCNISFSLVGSSSIRCNAYGYWSGIAICARGM